jgi:hypothetical protein
MLVTGIECNVVLIIIFINKEVGVIYIVIPDAFSSFPGLKKRFRFWYVHEDADRFIK